MSISFNEVLMRMSVRSADQARL